MSGGDPDREQAPKLEDLSFPHERGWFQSCSGCTEPGFNAHESKESEIIAKIAEEDETKGSCSSLVLAYIGNKCGFDVRDFRGGNSQYEFSRMHNIKNIADLDGVSSKKIKLINETGEAAQYLKQLELDNEFFIATGSHL